MGCSFSGLNAIYGAGSGGDVWINENRFKILRALVDGGGLGGAPSVYLVKEVLPNGAPSRLTNSKSIDPSHISDDGTYAMKKVTIQSEKQLELVREEIRISSLFNHPNLLPLIDHAIISVKGAQEGVYNYEAYLLFPVHLDGTLQDNSKDMQTKKEFFPTLTVLHIFRQLCSGLEHMHSFDPPYAHNDVKPGNVLIKHKKGESPVAILMDFGCTQPAKRHISSHSEAKQLQEWAVEHSTARFRAPELWDCPSPAELDERNDIWSLGCTLYAIMYGESPFEYAVDESEGSLQLAIVNAQIKWPTGPNPPYPESLHQFVVWMLQPHPAVRPHINDIIIHVDKLISKFS